MTVSYSTNLGLALPAQGDWAGSWGTNQNQFITQYLDAAIAGAQVISGSQTAVTLSTTNGLALSQAGSGATGSAQYAVINCTGNPASMLTITAPLTDKTYVIINATSTSQAVKIVGVGPTTGVTVAAAIAAMVAWNGADFVLVATTDASKLAGTLAVANGGTGQTTYTNGQLLIGNSTGNTLTKANLTAGTGIAITNGAGSISIANTAPDQTVTLTGAGATTTSGTYPNFTISSVNTTYGQATVSVDGLIKLGDATVQSVAASPVTATAARTYALQLNSSGQGVINVPWTDTVYTLPSATNSVLGGIKLGDATQQTTAANTVTATASRTYALQVNASGQGLVNVPWTDTVYTLPTATDTVLGGIKLGDATVQSVAANTVTATASRTYAVQLTSTGNAVVNVPWTAGSGTVTSVGATSPVASSGGTAPTISLSTNYGDTQNPYASKTANNFLAAPNGSAGAPTFRAIVAADIPTLNQNTTGSAGSATNIAGGAANRIPYNTGAGATSFITAPTTATTFLTWNGSAFIWSNVAPSGSTFATDISVNTLTVGKGPNNPTGTTTFGYQAGAAATTNNVQQTALGYRALATATTTAGVGFDYEGSTAVGYKALENSTPSILSYNTAVGAGALKALTTGGMNTAIGAGAARSVAGLQTGAVAVGAVAAERSTVGGFTVVGYNALKESTTRSYGSTAVGLEALRYASTNSGNSSIYNEYNTAIGHNALFYLDADTSGLSGNNNTALGYLAGYSLESGSNNTIIGYGADASAANVSNEITLGNSSVTTLRCQVTSITSLSDQRDKYDIEDLPLGLNLINALRPRRYKWDKRDWYIDEVKTTQEDGTITREKVAVPKDGSRAQTDWNEGFVAQEAKTALQSLGADWFPLVYDVNPEKLEMSSGKLIPVLVKAIQELTARIELLEAK